MHSFCNTKFQQKDRDVSNNNWRYGKEDKDKNLWVIFDSLLSLEHHIKSLCSLLNGTLSYLNRVKNTLDQKSRMLLINALIFSHLKYCSSIWGKCSEKLQHEIQKKYQLCCRGGKQWEIFKTRPRHPTITRLEMD